MTESSGCPRATIRGHESRWNNRSAKRPTPHDERCTAHRDAWIWGQSHRPADLFDRFQQEPSKAA